MKDEETSVFQLFVDTAGNNIQWAVIFAGSSSSRNRA
jgi:hypothetical protein